MFFISAESSLVTTANFWKAAPMSSSSSSLVMAVSPSLSSALENSISKPQWSEVINDVRQTVSHLVFTRYPMPCILVWSENTYSFQTVEYLWQTSSASLRIPYLETAPERENTIENRGQLNSSINLVTDTSTGLTKHCTAAIWSCWGGVLCYLEPWYWCLMLFRLIKSERYWEALTFLGVHKVQQVQFCTIQLTQFKIEFQPSVLINRLFTIYNFQLWWKSPGKNFYTLNIYTLTQPPLI